MTLALSSKLQPLRLCFHLGQLVDKSAEKYGNTREAVVSVHQGPLRKTFEDIKNDAEDLASGLLALGMEQGDRVGIWGPNSYE